MTSALPLRTLRAHAVRRSLFAPVALAEAVARLGFVQLDPIRAPARAADLILRHRVAGYRAGDLERAFPALPLVEDFVHVYGVLPAATQPLLHPRPRGVWQVEREHPRLAARILAHVRAHGETHPRDLHAALGKASVRNGWGGRSAATTRTLEALHYGGRLAVVRRESGIRVYALAPEQLRPRPRPRAAGARADDLLALLLGLYAPLPEASLAKLARMVAGTCVPDAAVQKALAHLREGAGARRVVAAGVAYLLPKDEEVDADATRDDRVALLAPFDPVVWDRVRFAHFWGWDYRFEAYTPESKRRFGYYALPLLWRDDAIGWANAAVAGDTLDVRVGFAKARPRGAAFRRALEAEGEALARAVGARRFALGAA